MEARQLPEDFKDFIRFLNKNEVCYLLIGGWAVGIFGHPRVTKDIDFFSGDYIRQMALIFGTVISEGN